MTILASPRLIDIVRYALRNRQYGEALEIIKLLKEEELKLIFDELLFAAIDHLGYVQDLREQILRIDHTWLYDHIEASVRHLLLNPQVDLFYAYPLLFALAVNVNPKVATYIIDQAKRSQDPELIEVGEDLQARFDGKDNVSG